MSEKLTDLNIELLIGVRQHLDDAAKLRALLERLLRLAANEPVQVRPQRKSEVRRAD